MKETQIFHELAGWLALHPWAKYLLTIALLAAGAWVLKKCVMRFLYRWAKKTETSLDDELLILVDRALTPCILLGFLAALLNWFPIPVHVLAVLNRVVYLAVLAVALFYAAKVVQLFLNHWLARATTTEEWEEPVRLVVRVLFAGLGTMIVLDNLGISLTAVWTTLGVGSVAIALALQDTLSNLFAGIYIRLDSPIRVGDYIKLEDGCEGFVTEIGVRSTWVRTLPNNTVVIPNSKLATAIITNYSLPESQMSLLIPVGVGYDSDPDQVERILVEEATQAAGHVEGLLAEPAPFVRFIPGFGESSLDFTLICRVQTFVDQYLAQHELRKRILARFRREGIQIPYPQRDVHLFEQGPVSSGAV